MSAFLLLAYAVVNGLITEEQYIEELRKLLGPGGDDGEAADA